MRKNIAILLVAGAWLGLRAPAAAAPAGPAGDGMPGMWMMTEPAPVGRWVTANHDAVIQIAPCGADLCGKIVGMALAPGEPVPRDWQGQTQCGLTIIDTAPGTDGDGKPVWRGSITDPRDGSNYHARIVLDGAHHLLLRGYLGLPIFGQTQTWTAYSGNVTASCRLGSAG